MILNNETDSKYEHTLSHLQKQIGILENKIFDVFNVIPVLIAISTIKDGKLLSVNQAWQDVLGYTYEELIGNTTKNLDLFIDYNERQKMKQMILQKGRVRNIEMKVKTKTGKIITGLFSGDIFINENEKLLITTMTDITEMKLTQTNLDDARNFADFQQRQIEAILENMNEAMIVVDSKENLIMTNCAALKPCSRNQSKRYIDIIKESDMYTLEGIPVPIEERPIFKAIQGEIFTNYEIMLQTKDNDGKMVLSCSGSSIYDNSGNFLAVITFTDITEKIERKEFIALAQADEKRREALEKAIQMKDEFLMLISHEFKTPLTIISSSVQAMEQICKNELSDKAKNFINKIKKGTNRQLKLINNLLDITKIKNDSLSIKNQNIEIVLLTRSIVEFIRIYAEQKNITLSFRTRLKNKIIGIDVNKYERILLNLLSNAIKYTPKGKSIKVTLSQKNLYGNKKIQLSVVDSGIGIPADKVKTIFEKFGQVDGPLTRQAEGTGIGLYLVKILVEKMNGHITVDSKEGIGSSFNVYLPADKTKDHLIKEKIEELTEDRLAHAVAIEFSDIFI